MERGNKMKEIGWETHQSRRLNNLRLGKTNHEHTKRERWSKVKRTRKQDWVGAWSKTEVQS